MRYFYVTFSHYEGDGSLTIVTEGGYPNREGLIKDIIEKDPEITNVNISNIIELSEQDYKDFTGEG